MKYFLAPRSNETAYKNFVSTINVGVNYSQIKNSLNDQGKEILSKVEVIYAWGNKSGKAREWDKIEKDDLIIFYAKGFLVMSGRVIFKQHSKELALSMWPADKTNNEAWEYTYFINDLQYFKLPIQIFSKFGSYNLDRVQGFMEIKSSHVSSIVENVGTVEKMLTLFTDENSQYLPEPDSKINIKLSTEITPKAIEVLEILPVEVKAKNKKKPITKPSDFEVRGKEQRFNGSRGEEIVMKFEKDRLKKLGREDLAAKVLRLSESNMNLGYDIQSYNEDGKEIFIEVKSSDKTEKEGIAIFISESEREFLKNTVSSYLYFVFEVNSDEPKIIRLENPFQDKDKYELIPQKYIVKFNLKFKK